MRSLMNANVNVVANDRQDRADVAGIASMLLHHLLCGSRIYLAKCCCFALAVKTCASRHPGHLRTPRMAESTTAISRTAGWRPEQSRLLAFCS